MQERKSNLPAGMKGFLAWMAREQPMLHERLLTRIQSGTLGDMGSTAPVNTESTQPVSSSLADTIKNTIMALSQGYLTYEQTKAQSKVLDLQLQRAKAGLPPLDINSESFGVGPSVSVGLSPSTKRLLMWGGIGLGAVILLPRLIGSRRR